VILFLGARLNDADSFGATKEGKKQPHCIRKPAARVRGKKNKVTSSETIAKTGGGGTSCHSGVNPYCSTRKEGKGSLKTWDERGGGDTFH